MKVKKDITPSKMRQIFNFTMSSVDRKYLEKVAATWGVSLAETIRRSMNTAHKQLGEEPQQTAAEQDKDNRAKTLETTLALHTELASTHSCTEDLVELVKTNKSQIETQLQNMMKPVNATAIKMSALINSLENRDQVEAEIKKLWKEKSNNAALLCGVDK